MSLFTQSVHPENIKELIDLTVKDNSDSQSMADMQSEGIAALYNILCKYPFAYLADDVGMGKTYQALGLAALVWNEKPSARILFISPRQNLQEKWFQDYQRFLTDNYRRQQKFGDDRATSILFRRPIHRRVLFHNLRSWTRTIGLPEPIAPFIRHTSFMRPLVLDTKNHKNMNTLWNEATQKLKSSGIYVSERPDELTRDDASRQLNIAFAKALNKKLTEVSEKQPYFDLVILDEAQCLRHKDNQTNEVLFEALRGHVNRWLFMSATPTHGSLSDLPNVLNHYPNCDKVVLDPQLVNDPPAMQDALQDFLIRRQRQYNTKNSSGEKSSVGKSGEEGYRNHDKEGWQVKDDDMSTLGTLAMGLVQKGLDNVLQSRSNRYRTGFLSSFESLESSIKRTLPTPKSDGDTQENQESSDFHQDHSSRVNEIEAPDTGFINDLAKDFEKEFKMNLPHPKVDSVVDKVAPLAFGTDTEIGGQKFLIFTRRISTVDTLQERLTERHQKSIEDRVRRCWKTKLDWSGDNANIDETDNDDDPEGFETEPGKSKLRIAMSKKGWLYKYRQTFRGSGKNTLFFEDGWLQRLCLAGGVEPAKAAKAIPKELWAECWEHAPKSAGDRLRYLAIHAIKECPKVFGLDDDQAKPWIAAYEVALHEHLNRSTPGNNTQPDEKLFTTPTLWTIWDEYFPEGPLALPASKLTPGHPPTGECLFQRQVARTLLGQIFRLTDSLIDLYFADQQSEDNKENFPKYFLDWLDSADPSASQIKHDCSQWIAHLRLIVDSSLNGAGKSWRELARKESWSQLKNILPVFGVTGKSGVNLSALRLFLTPSLPKIIVCTDTLKEGVDLHLFCDKVLHYGVAWTSGDLEQRTGRVDRYFSQIERRLLEGSPPEVQLLVGYPHVVSSIELNQVEKVIKRQEVTEQLMDSPLANTNRENKEETLSGSDQQGSMQVFNPYRQFEFLDKGRKLVAVNETDIHTTFDHYKRWYSDFKLGLKENHWDISPTDESPVLNATINKGDQKHDIKWSYDTILERYILTFSNTKLEGENVFSVGMRKRKVDRNHVVESFLRLLVPKPKEDPQNLSISRMLNVLEGQSTQNNDNTMLLWEKALASVANENTKWTGNSAQASITIEERKQNIELIVYDGRVQILSKVASLEDLENREEWGGEPNVERVRNWALETSNDFEIGYLNLHESNGLIFGNHLVHGELSECECQKLIKEVAWRADAWEAALTGEDLH